VTSSTMTDKTIIITGGGAGIGRAVAHLCAQRGDRIAVLDREGATAERTAAEARERGAKSAMGIPCDVTVEQEVESAMRKAAAALGPLWGVFANAGMDLGGFVHELPFEQWQRVIATNLNGVYLTCKHALREMLTSRGGGSMVCTSSPAAFVAFAAGAAGAYSASKGAVSALVRTLAIDYAKHGIRVNAVVPGPTETRLMWANVPESEITKIRQTICAEVPLGRLADPEEPARAVVWLLSEESSYVTGSHLVCDGGVLAKASVSV
jgi:NAD(P)-dependent dehydrogenase (short-subunit alcohol dehydrogenase family)